MASDDFRTHADEVEDTPDFEVVDEFPLDDEDVTGDFDDDDDDDDDDLDDDDEDDEDLDDEDDDDMDLASDDPPEDA